jgi:hypothetical protein
MMVPMKIRMMISLALGESVCTLEVAGRQRFTTAFMP